MPHNSDALFGALLGTAVDGIIVIDGRGIVQIYNGACERLFSYPAAEVIGRNVNMLMPEPYHSAHDSYLTHHAKTGERRIIGIGREVVGLRKDGTTFPMYLSVGEGGVEGEQIFVGIIHDLTALREETARRSETTRRLAEIVQASDDAILSKSLEGTILTWNRGAERIFGYQEAEAVGRHISLLIPEDRLAEEDGIIAHLRAGHEIHHFETRRRRKDGREIDVSITISPLRDAEGNVVGASKIVRDVSDKKEAEARLLSLQAELAHVARLSAMGQMSSALAHELNQPLTAINNYVMAARRTLEREAAASAVRARELIDKAAGQVLRAGAIIRNLRDFVEKRESRRAPEDLNHVVEEAIMLAFAGNAHLNVRIVRQFAQALPRVLIDKIQIQQVLLNLIRNGIEAMQSAPRRELTIRTEDDGEEFARVTVSDSGPGLSEAVRQSLFRPFVTTKERGMGIGLTICESIVSAHGGTIGALPASAAGASFEFRIPLVKKAEVAA